MIKAIDRLPGKKNMTERVVKRSHASQETFEIVQKLFLMVKTRF